MPLQMIQHDITTMNCDAIVNPTNPYFLQTRRRGETSSPAYHVNCTSLPGDSALIRAETDRRPSTDGAINMAAGPELLEECKKLPYLSRGDVVSTKGYNLPCKYVIHTAGPRWLGGDHNEQILLRSCYVNSLLLASEMGCKSIAFPLISAGRYGFPKDQVLHIALKAIRNVLNLMADELDVTLCIYDPQAYELSNAPELKEYLNEAPVIEKKSAAELQTELSKWLNQNNDSFAVTLFKLIDKKGMTDVECYKKANIKKQTFWKIGNSASYTPKKETILALAIALELTLGETTQLLKTAGLSFSESNKADRIVEFYLKNRIYDIYEIDSALFQNQENCLFSQQ